MPKLTTELMITGTNNIKKTHQRRRPFDLVRRTSTCPRPVKMGCEEKESVTLSARK